MDYLVVFKGYGYGFARFFIVCNVTVGPYVWVKRIGMAFSHQAFDFTFGHPFFDFFNW